MASRYTLELLSPEEISRWDELIAGYESRELFHRKAWLNYLEASRGVTIRHWRIRSDAQTVGYFCGGFLRKGPFRILGSPLKGWGTNFMGPVVNGDFNQAYLLEALDALAREERFGMLELQYRNVSEPELRAAGYEAVPTTTYLVTIAGDPEAMWSALNSKCRNLVRKATKSGLTVEVTDDPRVADDFYDQYCDLMRHKGLMPPYPREYPRLLVEHLRGAGLIFALRVRDGAGRVLASGLFPHDDRTVYFWGGASRHSGRELHPNDYLHWSVMRLAAERGLSSYDMCGTGQFKRKFGGTLVKLNRWHKCYWRTAKWARRGYELYFQKRLHLEGWWRRLFCRSAEG